VGEGQSDFGTKGNSHGRGDALRLLFDI